MSREKAIVSGHISMLRQHYPRYERLYANFLEDMEDLDEMTTGSTLTRIFRAIDEGCRLESEIERRTGIEKVELKLLLERMLAGGVLRKTEQGGKTDGARGARKWLWSRVAASQNN